MRRDAITLVAVVAVTGSPPDARLTGPFRLAGDDPLEPLVDGWVARWARGDEAAFEVAASTVLARRPELPDYYLVAGGAAVDGGPFDEPVLRRHWYLGFLAGLRPGRVAPGDRVVDGIRSLGTGPWWPALDEVVGEARRFRADALAVSSASSVTPPVLTSNV